MNNLIRTITLCLVAISLVAILSISAFASPGQRLPVEKVLPSATAVIERTGGITQTPSAFSGNPYDTTYLYKAGSADNSVLLTVYTDEGYTDTSNIYTGLKSLHYVFTSKSNFSFNIDFGNVPIQLFDHFVGADNTLTPTKMALSVRAGMASTINSNGLPAGLSNSENINTDLFLNTFTLDGSEYFQVNQFSGVGSYEHIDYEGKYGMAINSVAGVVDFDRGNNYQYVDVRICLLSDDDEFGFFAPRFTSCDVLNNNYLTWLREYSSDGGYEIGYSTGYDSGYIVGYDEGSEYGWDVGYDIGYGAGVEEGAENAIEEMGFFAFFIKSIKALMDFPLFPLPNGGSISLGLLLGTIVGAMAFVWLLKLIAGG